MADTYSDATTIVAAYLVIAIVIGLASVAVLIVWEHLSAMWAAYRLGRIERKRERR